MSLDGIIFIAIMSNGDLNEEEYSSNSKLDRIFSCTVNLLKDQLKNSKKEQYSEGQLPSL